ncbi:UNVERIFIED_CONTAM: Cyclin-dependent kinase F-4 [Sesamum radiatum]|uniref:Cyclin-dependent kinase F-4 n=1 Tax=Sesamum radiatum TaxID=300843 RepID=A0AAW2KZI2_SESRA
MPFPLPVVLDSNTKRLTLSRTWSKFAPGQIATSTGFFHSRKFSTGGFSALEIFFLFPLSIVLSEKLCSSDQYRRLNAYHNGQCRYKVIKEVGNGTFGSVWRALSKQSGEVSLRKMNHPNIVKLKEVIREHDVLYFVFEYMECNLYQLMKDRTKLFSEAEIRNWCFQVFQGLAYIHQRGYFHRDLKPENLLVSKDIIKIADFGLAREINSNLHSLNMSRPAGGWSISIPFVYPFYLIQVLYKAYFTDMWAMGAIMAELFTLRPLFPGSSEADEIYKICSVIGSPTKSEWSEGLKLASAINYQFPQVAGVHLSVLVPGVSEEAINLIAPELIIPFLFVPNSVPLFMESLQEADSLGGLQHPFFQSCFYVPPSLRPKAAIARTPPSAGTKGVLEQNCGRRYPGSLSNLKPTNRFSSAKPQASLSAGVQRKLDMNNQDLTKNDKNLKNYVKQQPRYRPPGMNGPCNMGKTRGVLMLLRKLSNMTVGSVRPLARPSVPPPMKAGGWHGQSDLFWTFSRSCSWKSLYQEGGRIKNTVVHGY